MNLYSLVLLSASSRLSIFIIQFISNRLIEDHQADAFNPPKNSVTLVDFFLSGFSNWDAKHFLHIAQHGYIFEHSGAFFPLYPFSIRLLSTLIGDHLLSGCILNFTFFTISTIYLHKLTLIVFQDDRIGLFTVWSFLLNPANVFFSSCYTESLYSMLTFMGLFYTLTKMEYFGLIAFFLSALTRSNGLLNFGYIAFANLRTFLNSERSMKGFFCTTIKLAIQFGVISSAFVAFQFYLYKVFCQSINKGLIEENLYSYARENGFKIFYDMPKSDWCFKTLPFSYSYIQSVYWKVGFLQYWHWKQIPNFVLAVPIVWLCVKSIVGFGNKMDSGRFYNLLGLMDKSDKINLHPFVVHSIFMLVTSLFFMHVQVSTRFICSSNPLIYWWVASILQEKVQDKALSFALVWNKIRHDNNLKFVFYYFVSYSFIGTILFSNYLPFT